MKVVVDEGVPRQLVSALVARGIEASRFPKSWGQMSNGDLIAEIERLGFDVLLTNDKNIASQKSLRGRSVAVVALPHNRRKPILERVDDIVETLSRATPGRHIVIGLDGSRTATQLVDVGEESEELPPVEPFKF